MAKANSTTFDQQVLEEELQKLNETKKSIFDNPSFTSFRLQKSSQQLPDPIPQIQPIGNDSLSCPPKELDFNHISHSQMNEQMINSHDFPNGQKNESNSLHEISQQNIISRSNHRRSPPHPHSKRTSTTTKFFLPHMNTLFSPKNDRNMDPILVSPKLPDPRLIQILLQLTTRLAHQNIIESVNMEGLQAFYKSKVRTQKRFLPENLEVIDPRDYFTWEEVLPPLRSSVYHPIPDVLYNGNRTTDFKIKSEQNDFSKESSNGENDENPVLPTKRKRQNLPSKCRLSKSF
jgi:hypothetical protein